MVGLHSLVEFVPLMGMAFVGGALSDAFDRRRMVQISELGSGLAVGVLFVNALLPHPHIWVLFAVLPILAALYGLLRPSLDAMVPRLVSREELPAASALDSFYGTTGSIAGPALAGVIIAAAGVSTAYAIDAATYGASLVASGSCARCRPRRTDRPSACAASRRGSGTPAAGRSSSARPGWT